MIKGNTIKASYAECQDLIVQYQLGKLELQPGCNAEQSLETLVTGKLNTIRETASKVQLLPRRVGLHTEMSSSAERPHTPSS